MKALDLQDSDLLLAELKVEVLERMRIVNDLEPFKARSRTEFLEAKSKLNNAWFRYVMFWLVKDKEKQLR